VTWRASRRFSRRRRVVAAQTSFYFEPHKPAPSLPACDLDPEADPAPELPEPEPELVPFVASDDDLPAGF
jgi:hypothetical protein